MRDGKRTGLPKIRALALAVQTAWGFSAWAAPEGAVVVTGQVAVSQPSAGLTRIQASHGSIINWKQFSIGAGETTQFVQPLATSAVLNRVVGPDVSTLLGQLKANGQVFLINPNGIVIGNAARIDTNSFIASTLDISDADFLTGRLKFSAATSAGRIRNEGVITAGPGGSIALIAPDIENTGIIRAPDGNILLAAGRKLEITSMDLDGVTFEIQAPTDSVLNLGKILAENGAARAFAGSLRNSGEIRANRLVQDSDGSIVLSGSSEVTLTADSVTSASGVSGGSIVVQSSDGVTRIAGQLDATGTDGKGGDIRLLGERVAIDTGTTVDVSGNTGGGQILVGGDYQGKNVAVQNAQRVAVGQNVDLRADATGQGDGGRVIVWADENTRYYGSISARGGPQGGNGGFAEVSGKQNLEFAGTADLSASNGASGTLLLDPLDIIVSSTSGIVTSVVDEFADFASNIATVSPAHLAAVAGNVTLQAERNIYIKDAIALTTSGAGLSITAGGENFNAGTLYNNAGISTTAGAVTLRAQALTGNGGVTTNGGAVDILTSGSLNYYSAINSGGGMVTLGSQNSSVNYAQVEAGSGTINVTGQNGISGGDYSTTGTANLTATAGGIYTDVTANVANLTSTSSISADVNVTGQVNATSTGSSVYLYNNASGPLRLGNLTSQSGLTLQSYTGMVQAVGGLLTSPYITLYNGDSATSSGTIAEPLRIAAPSGLVHPRVAAYDIASSVHVNFASDATIGGISLDGTVTGVGASTVTGSSNLTSLALSAGTGVLNVSAAATAGMTGGFELTVSDGAINASTLTLPDTAVDLAAAGAITIGTMTGKSLFVTAKGAVDIGSAETTGNSGISVYTNQCYYWAYTACIANSPITAGTLNAGTNGGVNLTTDDNGNITVTGSLTGKSAYLSAGSTYYTSGYPYYYTAPTTNTIDVASATTLNSFTAYHSGEGDIQIDSLTAGGSVYVYAGNNYSIPSLSYPYYTSVTTNNNISINNVDPVTTASSYQIQNSGIGNISLTGNISRPTGSIYLSANQGTLSSTGNLAARYVDVEASGATTLANVTATEDWVRVTSGGTLAVGEVMSGTAGSYYAGVDLQAQGNLVFSSISSTSNGYYSSEGSVTLTSSTGSVRASVDGTTADISATGNVTITAADALNGSIGNSAFTNPLDIKAGASRVVTLMAGKDIGAAGKAVNVDTSGTIDVASSGGQFHVAATDGVAETNVATIRLAASASGIGSGNSSVFTSANFDVTASSNGSSIALGNLVQTTGTLNEFKFLASGSSALTFDSANLATATGANRLILSAGNGLAQTNPVTTNNIDAGSVSLAGGAGSVVAGNVSAVGSTGARITVSGADITLGNLSGTSVSVTGQNLDLGAITSSGLNRVTYSGLLPDAVSVSASGNVVVHGDIASATSINVATSGGDLTIEGAVDSTGVGRSNSSLSYQYAPYYYVAMTPDKVSLAASGNISTDDAVTSLRSASVVAGGSITVGGPGIFAGTTGDNTFYLANDLLTVTAGSAATLDTLAIMGGYNTTVSAGTLNVTSGITGVSNNSTITGTTFNTGNLEAAGILTVNATGDYAPESMTLQANHVVVNSGGDITIGFNDGITDLVAPTVTLRAEGNVQAELTDTTNVTVESGRGFDIYSNTWLSNASITAQWDKATNSNGNTGSTGASLSTNSGNGTQSFGYGFDGPLYMNIGSSGTAPAWNMTYRDTAVAAVASGVELSNSHTGSGTFNVSFASATTLDVSASLGATRLMVSSLGDVNLNNVTTVAGRVDATSSNANVTIDSLSTSGGALFAQAGDTLNLNNVDTGGGHVTASAGNDVVITRITTSAVGAGSVSLTSQNGDIRMAGIAGQGIDTSNIGTTPSSGGTVTLIAANGSVGADGQPIELNYASGLTVRAMNAIAVQANNSTLTALAIDTYAAGTGSVDITGSHNFAGLDLTRIDTGTNISLTGLAPATAGAFSLTVRDGGIKVDDNISNVTNLTLDAKAGNVEIKAPANTSRTAAASGAVRLLASNDVLIAAGTANAAESVSVAGGTMQIEAGRDVLISAGAGSAAVTSSGSAFQQILTAGRDFSLSGGTGADAYASVALNGITSYQTMSAGGNWTIQGGSGAGSYASLETTNTSQQTLNVTGNLLLQGGTGADAYARMAHGHASFGTQNITISGNLSVLGGNALVGQGAGAYAELLGKVQNLDVAGNVLVAGGTAADNSALISASSNQTLGEVFSGSGPVTDSVTVQGGSGDRAFARVAAVGSQAIYAGMDGAATGDITVSGGSGTDALAEITAGSSQTIGSQNSYCGYYGCYVPTNNILVSGGLGSGAYGSILATGYQSIYGGGNISVTGSSGAGAFAQIVSTGSGQTIGSSSNSSTNATDSILVQAGSGGLARILAASNQSIMPGGDLSVIGGSGNATTASIESTGGFQSIGYTYLYSNDPIGSIAVTAGSGTGSAAWIKAATGQAIDAGGSIALTAGAQTGAFAEIGSIAGTQTIGNLNSTFSYDRTDSLTLTGGGAAGSYARIGTGGSQNIRSVGDILLTGGVGDNSGALLEAGASQSMTGLGALTITGGSGSTASGNESGIVQQLNGSQTIQITGDITLTGGASGSDTFIRKEGTATQTITSLNGSLLIEAPLASGNVDGSTGISSGTGNQNVNVSNGTVTVNNEAGAGAYLVAGADQTINTRSMSVSLSSTTAAAPYAKVDAVGNQTINLSGDSETAGTATLSVVNLSNISGSYAAVAAGGNQSIMMNYDAAGLVKIGDVAGKGLAEISAGGDHTMVAGQLLIQGGATAAAESKLMAGGPNTMLVSTLYGPVELKGGSDGPASIDPAVLSVVSNGSVLLQAGTNSTALANITAGQFDLASTIGDLSLINSTTSGALATIDATTFNFAGAGAVYLNGGTITATNGGVVAVPGFCNGCDTNLFGPFTISAYQAPPIAYGTLVTLDLLTLTELAYGLIGYEVLPDGTLVLSARRLSQCY